MICSNDGSAKCLEDIGSDSNIWTLLKKTTNKKIKYYTYIFITHDTVSCMYVFIYVFVNFFQLFLWRSLCLW